MRRKKDDLTFLNWFNIVIKLLSPFVALFILFFVSGGWKWLGVGLLIGSVWDCVCFVKHFRRLKRE